MCRDRGILNKENIPNFTLLPLIKIDSNERSPPLKFGLKIT